VIGSMFIYEEYHASLGSFLRSIPRVPSAAYNGAPVVSAASDKGVSVWMS